MQPVFIVALFELLNEGMAVDVVGGIPVFSCDHAQGICEVGFSDAGRAEKHDILGVLHETHGGKFVDLAYVDGRLEGEIKVLQSLFDGEPGHLNLFLVGPLTFVPGFLGKNMVKDIHDIQVILDGAFKVIIKNFNGIAHFEGFQIFFDAVIQNSIPPPKSAAQIVMKTGREPRAVVKLA